MTEADVIAHWQRGAREELEAAKLLRDGGHYPAALFHCHLAVVHRLVGYDRPARVRRTMERWLRQNEEARFYHWKRPNRLPPRRPGREWQGTQ